jgi:dUTPase
MLNQLQKRFETSLKDALKTIRDYGPMVQEVPVFKFALREDLKDDLRFLPTRAEEKASGWDVRAAQTDRKPIVLQRGPYSYYKIELGFRAFCPEGWWLELRPRSSTFTKRYLHCLYGVIDQTYEGQMILACKYDPPYSTKTKAELHETINFGDPLGQLIPVRRQEMKVEAVSNEEYDTLCQERGGKRKDGGFGSTTK